jgi:hypothetical protein
VGHYGVQKIAIGLLLEIFRGVENTLKIQRKISQIKLLKRVEYACNILGVPSEGTPKILLLFRAFAVPAPWTLEKPGTEMCNWLTHGKA